MKRMIAYIYLYQKENGNLCRCGNMGFCRVWQSGNRYIVNVCLKDACGVEGSANISTIKKCNEKDGRTVYSKNNTNICNTMVNGTLNVKLQVGVNDGIYIECSGRIYITLWNERMKDIEIVEKTEKIVDNVYMEKGESTRDNSNVKKGESTRNNSNVKNGQNTSDISNVKKGENTRDNSYAEKSEYIRERTYVENTEKIKNTSKTLHREISKENKNARNTELEQCTRIYNRLCKVRMIFNEVEYPAVKLKLHELMLLPRSCWRMANNIFLMESYYRYGHILFMQYGERYILAVPCQNKRGAEAMAKQCGFLENVTGYEYGRKRESKTYWIKEL